MDTCLKLTPIQAPELDTSGTISTSPETQAAGESSSDSDGLDNPVENPERNRESSSEVEELDSPAEKSQRKRRSSFALDQVPSTRKRAKRSSATPEVEKGLTKVGSIVDPLRKNAINYSNL